MAKRRLYRIVICTPAIYSAGGIERVVTVKANYFAEKLGYNVTVIVTEGVGHSCHFYLSEKVNVINFQLGFEELWKAPFFKKIYLYLKKQQKYKRMLTALLMKQRPDLTITTLRREINFLNSIHDGSVKIGELHVNRANYRNFTTKYRNPIKLVFARWWSHCLIDHLRCLDKIVLLTDAAMNDWPELDNKIKIPDPLPFQIDAKSSLLYNRIISIGRYDHDKGNDLLLQVWRKVENHMPEWHLDIYGNGNQSPYHLQIQQLGIDSSRCHLHGPSADVKKEYLDTSIFVLPSRFEGFGLVLIEAMACGVPVIAFDCENGPRSIITDGVDGFLIPPFDIDAYAEKMLLLMQDYTLRKQMGDSASKTASKYDIEIIGKQWKQLFDELMQNK